MKRENRFLGLREKALQLLNEAVFTDALLLYTPSELALAAFLGASKDAVLLSADKDVANEVELYVQETSLHRPDWAKLRGRVETELAEYLRPLKPLDMAAVKVAYKKLTDHFKAREGAQ